MQNLWSKIESTLLKVERPSRYFSLDDFPLPKENDTKICLIYPDSTEIGISNTGLAIIFQRLLETKSVYVDLAFAPWFDMEKILKERKIPLFSYLNALPLKEFDILGFSLPHELCYTNVLQILNLAGLPLERKQSQTLPLVIAGGAGAYNPLPMEDFIDAFGIGDGEELITDIVKSFSRDKPRVENLKRIAKVKGVFVPGLNNGAVKRIAGLGKKHNLSYSQNPVHNHASVEIMRGCSAGCRFCQAGFINRPVREKGCSEIQQESVEALGETGFDELSLLSLSTSDYSQIGRLSQALCQGFKNKRISLNLPSLRMDKFAAQLADSASNVRKNTLTFAPEAGSQSLRKSINKNINDEKIEKSLISAYKRGFSKIKLYFMVGLPREKEEDLRKIVAVVERARSLGRIHLKNSLPRIVVSASTFVPKPHTPLQWSKQASKDEVKLKQRYLQNKLMQMKGVTFKWHDANQSILEGVISRGDKKIAKVIKSAWLKGSRFDNWTEYFENNAWQEALKENNLKAEEYLKEKDIKKALPWDKIDCLVEKRYLASELKNYELGVDTPNCREECSHCGVCGNKPEHKLTERITVKAVKQKRVDKSVYEYQLVVTKKDRAKFLSHLEFIDLLVRAFRRCGLGLYYTQGYNPKPKLSFDRALKVGEQSNGEKVVLRLVEPLKTVDVINRFLPRGIKVKQALLINSRPINIAKEQT